MTTLSIFDAAREAPDGVALIDSGSDRTWSFAAVAARTAPLAAALAAAQPRALAVTPRADVESLCWLYAALATGTPLLPLHQRATDVERRRAMALASAVTAPPVVGTSSVPELAPPPATRTLAFLSTSGSTGTPRLVELSRAAMVASARASEQNLGWEPHDAWLLCLPLAHTGGLSIVLRCLLARRAVVLFEPGASGLLAELPRLMHALGRASLVSLVPSVLAALLDAGFVPPQSLRGVLVGGAGCSPQLAERAHRAGLPLLTSYGLTETASQVVTRRYGERYEPLPARDGVVSSGHALPGVSLELRGETIALRSDSLLRGYVGATEPAVDAQGFLVTSDRGELGERGELYVRGRSDDVIITGGENVDPLEVEAALLSLPGVNAACVFATASATFGQVVSVALVSDRTELADAAHLADLVKEKLARHKRPRRVVIVQNLPLTASGKVDRRACHALYAAALES